MGDNYLPADNDGLVTWGQNFTTYIQANLIPLGVTLPQVTPVVNAFTALTAALGAQTAAANNAQAATVAADAAAANFENQVRPLVAQMQVSPAVSDPEREQMGIPVYDKIRTRVAAPTTRPTVELGIAERLRHAIKFRDESTPDSAKKPDGVRECEIWFKVSETQPANTGDYEYLAGDSATPYIAVFAQPDAGKTVWYLLRWKNTRGEFGPWSFPASAKVPG